MTGERIFVALGSNLGDRRASLDLALAHLNALEGTRVVSVAPVLETAPLLPEEDPTPQPDYLNTVAELRSRLEPVPLLMALKAIERALGRTASTRWAPRLIDLDLVLYGSRQLESDVLTLPHPGLPSRRFVLEPLLALAPELVLPTTGEPLRELLTRLRG